MKKALILATVATLVGTQAFAQAKNFEGFSLGANVEVTKSTADATGALTGSDSGNSTGLGLQAQYSFALGESFVMGIGASLGTNNRNFTDASGALGVNSFSKNNTSIDFMPGYALSNTMLVYGKLSSVNGALQNDTAATSNSLSGLGYGIGLRSMLDKNTYFQVGYDSIKYDDIVASGVTTSPKTTNFSFGVGYKF